MDELTRIIDEIEREYAGLPIDEVISGYVVESPYGCCYLRKSEHDIPLELPPQDKLKRSFLERLELVFGIRENLWNRLVRYGVRTIKDLVNVQRFKPYARSVLNALEKGSLKELSNIIGTRVKSSDKLNLILPALAEKESIIFFDIETDSLGLTTTVLLLGLGHFVGDRFQLYQYLSLARRKDERAIISSFLRHTKNAKLLVSFCGKRFDYPVLQAKFSYYEFKDFDLPHLDLYYICKQNFAHRLPNCRLRTIEEHLLGLKRKNDIPSDLIPQFYNAYEQTGNFGFLKYIVEHNKEDILSLVRLFSLVSRI